MGRASRVIVLTSLFALACSGCTWSMFGFGPDNARFNPVAAGLNASNAGTIVVKGAATTGGMIDSSPAVVTSSSNGNVTGRVYVGSQDGKLYVFDEFGATNCSGTPKSCTPLWTATTGGAITSSPAVVNGVVYVGSRDGKLYAFDAAGNTNCSGTPKTCTPLWTAPTNANPQALGDILGSPTVANGVVYVTSSQVLYAFDAAGTTNCSGTTKTCAPLWTTTTTTSSIGSNTSIAPAVVNGIVYVAGNGVLLAFDAGGITNCSGTPKVCSPLWSGDVSGGNPGWAGPVVDTSAAVSNGVVYINSYGFGTPPLPAPRVPTPTNAELRAFDAAGATNCSGTPKVCEPLWSGATGVFAESSPAVANGVVYTASDQGVFAFNAMFPSASCAGNICQPLWSGATSQPVVFSSPAIENGVLYVGSDDGALYAFDASGTKNCAGTPMTCAPLRTRVTGGLVRSSPSPAGNTVFVGSEDAKLYAFGLP